jgi:hypothetical protein
VAALLAQTCQAKSAAAKGHTNGSSRNTGSSKSSLLVSGGDSDGEEEAEEEEEESAADGRPVLYVSAEETAGQVRAAVMKSGGRGVQRVQGVG